MAATAVMVSRRRTDPPARRSTIDDHHHRKTGKSRRRLCAGASDPPHLAVRIGWKTSAGTMQSCGSPCPHDPHGLVSMAGAQSGTSKLSEVGGGDECTQCDESTSYVEKYGRSVASSAVPDAAEW